MLFDDKKLQIESAKHLIQCPIRSVEPFALMLSPVYVLMKLNQKFVSVKAPLDFFTPDELERLRHYGVFYFPKFAKSSSRFQTSARLTKKILTLRKDLFDLSTHEISGECFKLLAPLWGRKIRVEPFFMSVFADELCEQLNSTLLLEARENNVLKHDQGLLLSGAAVFCALHLGWLDYSQLSAMRQEIYERTAHGEEWYSPRSELEVMISDLYRMIVMDQVLDLEWMDEVGSDWSRKLSARLQYLKSLNTHYLEESLTIHGESGFVA